MKSILVRLVLALTILGMLAVSFSACQQEEPGNQVPVISRVSGESASAEAGTSLTITCTASDPDGDSLSYQWSTTGGSLSGGGESVTWKAPEAEGTYTVSVTVTDGKGGSDEGSYTITVVTPGANRSPVISELTINPTAVEPEKPATVTCEASDPDGDNLTYDWWTELGRIEGTGNVVTWVAPKYLGEYTIEVIVRDGKGGNTIKSFEAVVALNEPPEITRLRAKPTSMLTDESTTITCTAEDPDGDPITYTWSAAKGVISGSGDTITWTAPAVAGYFDIEVTVADNRGGSSTDSITVQVEGLRVLTGITPVPSESGAIRSDGTVLSLWTVGDDSINNGIHTYLSFDISRITNVADFRGASLSISTQVRNGTPWTDLGDFVIDEVDYGTRALKSTDYDITGTRLERFDSAPAADIDLTQIIERALNDEESRFQIRLHFQEDTDGDDSPDNFKVTDAVLKLYFVGGTS